jgi:hypothetical protein
LTWNCVCSSHLEAGGTKILVTTEGAWREDSHTRKRKECPCLREFLIELRKTSRSTNQSALIVHPRLGTDREDYRNSGKASDLVRPQSQYPVHHTT